MIDDRDQAKIRLCIRCGGPFPSACAANRFCPDCKKKRPYVDSSYNPVSFERVLDQRTSKAVSNSINENASKQPGIDELISIENR